MKAIFTTLSMILILLAGNAECSETEEILHFGRFGNVFVYRNSPQPGHVVLFVSGDGGWNLGVVDMAKVLAENDTLVVGIDIVFYLKQLEKSNEACVYPAADFEMLSKFIQRQINFSAYRTPILVGYSSGATLVYAILSQSPPGTFGGAMSLGFCPDLWVNKPFCKGSGLEWQAGAKGKGGVFLPVHHLKEPWIVFQGDVDQVCNPDATEQFVRQVNLSRLILLQKVGHGFSVQKNWMPQFKAAFSELVTGNKTVLSETASKLSDLPIVEIPAANSRGNWFAVMVTGDGGWAGLDREIGTMLSENGVPVVGLNTLAYFWTPRTPEGAAKDLSRIINHYASTWKKEKTVLVGYSFGAEVLPFMCNRLQDADRQKISGMALIGPGRTANFEFHFSNWISGSTRKTSRAVLPEIEALRGYPLLCFAGSNELESLCRDIKLPQAKIVILPGGHHLGGDYDRIAQTILSEIQ